MAFGSSLAGSARVVLGVDTRDFNRDMQGAERQFSRSTKAMDANVGQLSRGVAAGSGAFRGFARSVAFASAGFLGAAGFTALVRQSVNAASDLNEAINRAAVTFRGSTPDILKWSETAAEALGMSRRAALENASSIGAMLIPMGYARDNAAGMSKAMVQLAADLGSINNQDPSEMLDRIRAGLAGETEPLRRFGVDLRQASVDAFALKTGLLEQGQTLSASGQLWARYQLLLRQTADAQGDFARTSGGAANQQRTLRATIEEAEAALGRAFIPTLERLLPKLTGWANAIADNKELQQQLVDGVETTIDVVGRMVTTADDVARALGGWKDTLQAIFALGVATKLVGMARAFTVLAGTEATAAAAGGAGAAAGLGGAAARSALLLRHLRALSLIGTITIGIEVVTHWEQFKKDFTESLKDFNWVPGKGWVFGKEDKGSPTGVTMQAPGGGQAKVPGGAGMVFPIPAGTKFTRGGGAAAHGSRPLGNWQSDNAVDIMVEPGTRILSVVDGVVTKVSGQAGFGSGSTIFGFSVTISGQGNRFFYTHLGAVYVEQGEQVSAGQVIGRAAAGTPGGAHLHFGVERGTPESIYLAARGKLAGAGGGATVTPPADLVAPPKRRKAKKKSQADPDDPLLAGLYLRLATSEDTKRLDDDLKALQALDAYLSKKIALERKVAEKTKLIRERQGIRGDILDVQTAIRDARPLPAPVRIPGLAAVLGEAGQLASGSSARDLGGGLGKVLVPHSLAPTVAAWGKLIGKLKLKLRAALGRRRALVGALQRLGRIKGKLRDPRLIQWHQQQIASLDDTISDIRGALGEAMAAQADVAAEAASKAQEDADEAERAAIAQARANEEVAAEDVSANAEAAEAWQQALVATPAETRLALAQAEGTADTADDLAALRAEESRLVGNLGRGNVETEIQIVTALNSVRAQIIRLTEVAATTAGATLTLVDIEKNRESFLQGLRSLRSDQSNLFDPLAELRGGRTIQVANYFQQGPPDSHLWSKALEFELRTLVA